MHTQHIHNINSHMVASVTQSPVCPCPFVSVLKLFQAVSRKQWTAWVYLLSKRSVLNNGQLEFIFILFQVVSPRKGQLEFVSYFVSSGQP